VLAPRALLLGLALAPAMCVAQGFDGSQPLDAYTGPVLSSGRIIGLGGAYVGVAEGPAGAPVNPASVAQRDRHLDRPWDLSGVATWFVPEVADLSRQDLGNDGARDGGLGGFGNLQLGFGAQAGRLGVGFLARVHAVSARGATGSTVVSTTDVAVTGGWSGWQDTLVVGVSVGNPRGGHSYTPEGGVARELEYEGRTLRAGTLWRPRGRSFRVGLSFDAGARATARARGAALPVASPAAFVFPWIVSAGASAWIGPNARRYNEPAPVALAFHPEWGEGPGWDVPRRSPVLVTAQLDVVGPAPGALALESALFPGTSATRSGRNASLVPRVGVEWEPRARTVRLRAGSYLEPSRSGAGPRGHACLGVEARVPFWPWDLQLSLAADLARAYTNASVSVGFWSELGPGRPPAPAPAVLTRHAGDAP
jgi:hypothetical protein